MNLSSYLLVLTLAPAALNAQCASALQWPRWVWQTLEWVDYIGSYNTFSNAAYSWQGQDGNNIVFTASQQYEDLILSYQTLPTGTVAQTIPHTQLDNSLCARKTDYCGICMNGAVFYDAKLQFDAAQLSDQYQIYSAEGYVQNYDQVALQAFSHELGHVLREGELGLAYSQVNCSATSIMGTLDVNLRCGHYVAQQCDGNTYASAYSGWLFDAPVCEANPICNGGGSSGQTCS